LYRQLSKKVWEEKLRKGDSKTGHAWSKRAGSVLPPRKRGWEE
jgi:hypothetical protein